MEEKRMLMALEEAKKAYKIDEIPVGCVIFKENELISSGYNQKESKSNAILHTEMIAIVEACGKLGTWRLDDCEMYVTLEPCMMCMGAIIESRIKKVYFGAKNKSKQMYDNNKIAKRVKLVAVENTYCSELLTDFFRKRRK